MVDFKAVTSCWKERKGGGWVEQVETPRKWETIEEMRGGIEGE